MPQSSIQLLFQQATTHHQAGRLAEAEKLYRQILTQQPQQPDVLQLLGVIAAQQNQNETALTLIRQSLALNPNSPNAHINLGNVLKSLNRPDEALHSYRQALALNPNLATAHNNLGTILKERGQLPEAIAAYHHALRLNPNYHDARLNLALALKAAGQLDQAATLCRQVITLQPTNASAHNNLANILTQQGHPDQAIPLYRQALALRPNDAQVLSNLANALLDLARFDESAAASRQAIALNPDSAEAHRNLALALLTQGNLPEGFTEYEWRWRCPDVAVLGPKFSTPPWDGSPLQNRTILLHAEQGLGDSIHFARFATPLAQQGARVILACQKQLLPLLNQIPGIHQTIDYTQPLPPFDTHCPLMSLPKVLQTALDNIAAKVPYLSPDPHALAHWQRELASLPGLKVGIAWQGNPHNSADHQRSLPLHLFEPLARLPNITLISLQKGPGTEQIQSAPFPLLDFADRLDGPNRPFTDSPALIKTLDLVITADTVTCHLAGALAVPVWTLLRFSADWRWLQNRSDTPWYPTMRLFRQTSLNDWPSALRQVTAALAQFPR